MDDHRKMSSRRAFLEKFSFAAAVGSLFASCRFESADEAGAATMNAGTVEETTISCTDVSGLTEQQIQTRKSLQYVDSSPHAAKRCNNCKLFKPPAAGEECGGCQVVPGPIHPKGYCTAWVKAAG